MESLVLAPSVRAPLLQLVHESFKFVSGIPFPFKYASICFVDNIEDISFATGQFSCPALRVQNCYRSVFPHKRIQIFVSRVHRPPPSRSENIELTK